MLGSGRGLGRHRRARTPAVIRDTWIGRYPASKVWTDLVAGLPDGLSSPSDRGLDHTPTWGRTQSTQSRCPRDTCDCSPIGRATKCTTAAWGTGSKSSQSVPIQAHNVP